MEHRTDEERDRYAVPEDDREREPSPEGRMATAAAVDPAADERARTDGAEEREAFPEGRTATAAEVGAGDDERAVRATPSNGNGSDRFELYNGSDMEGYRRRWDTLQAGFVDNPADAAQQADALIGELVDRISQHRRQLHDELGGRDDRAGGDTESLRLAIRRYRAFFYALVGE
jgi:hypothetical protein